MTAKAPPATETGQGVARAVWQLLLDLFMSSMRERLKAAITDLELSPPQAHALKVLEPDRPLAMRELAATLHCDASNITGIVDRLEARGLVERRVARTDRRVKTLVVTPEGTRLRQRLLERLSEPPPAIARLSPAEQRQLRDLLRRLVTG
jgi:MarR family transcriptional regulator, organic hydroperoxide resistance regulator